MNSALPPLLSTSLEEHRHYLHRYALSCVRHRESADDVVQDALVAALEGKAEFRGESSLRTWLTAILKHKITDYQRRQARTPVRIGDLAPADLDGEFDEAADGYFSADGEWITPPSAWPSPEQSFENARFWETFERCLATLPPAVGRAFYLREIQGLSTDEICAELGITPNNCWVMLYRARMNLRQSLQEHWFEPAATR